MYLYESAGKNVETPVHRPVPQADLLCVCLYAIYPPPKDNNRISIETNTSLLSDSRIMLQQTPLVFIQTPMLVVSLCQIS